MRPADLERFDPRAVRAFEIVFGAALVANVLTELSAGVWHVHTGRLYPWRHLDIVPLWPAWGLAIEWAVTVLAGLAVAAGVARRIAPRVAALVTLAAVLQRYSNHGALLFLVAFYVALAPPRPADAGFAVAEHPNLGLVRAQLAIVYVFSAINKLAHGFTSGASLQNLLGWDRALARPASVAVVLAELALPAVLLVRPRTGIVAVALLHVGFAVTMPGLWSFGLTMVAMACLFLPPPGVAASPR